MPKGTRTLPVAFLRPGKFQPRKFFGEEALADLAQSVKEKGVLTPILVRPLGGEAYEIVAGERRWRAAQMAKLHDVPVVVREMVDAEALELAIIENVQRADLNVLEEAAAYQELLDAFRPHPGTGGAGGGQEPLAYREQRQFAAPARQRWFSCCCEREASRPDTPEALLSASDPEAAAREILSGGMNVRQAEQRSLTRKARACRPKDPNIKQMRIQHLQSLRAENSDYTQSG